MAGTLPGGDQTNTFLLRSIFSTRYCQFAQRFCRYHLGLDPHWRFAGAELDGIRNAILLRLGLGPHWQDPALALLPPLLQRVRGACEQAYTNYQPRSYPGRVTYFRALQRTPRMCDPLVVWRRIANLDVIPMDGGHFDLVQPPYVANLAAALHDRLPLESCHSNDGG